MTRYVLSGTQNRTDSLASCLIYAWALPAHPYST